ncbi:MAG: helix-turn-helix transcriptional regulator [Flavobacteriales bacterium]|nr:helix-turn-helix transcriptional regulator [Flavobacteriales bacterium]
MKPIKLTSRETEIVKLIMQEKTSVEISNTLRLSIRTVDTHRKNILRKTGIKNLVGLTKYAIQNDWLPDFHYKK